MSAIVTNPSSDHDDPDEFEGFEDEIDEDYEFKAYRRRLEYVYTEKGCVASASSPNPSQTQSLSTKGTKDTDRKHSNQYFESEATDSAQMDIQCAGLGGGTLNGITLGRSTLGESTFGGSILGGSTEIRCESSDTPGTESTFDFQVRSRPHREHHTTAFKIERKLRRRRKAQTKKKREQIKKKEERLGKAKMG